MELWQDGLISSVGESIERSVITVDGKAAMITEGISEWVIDSPWGCHSFPKEAFSSHENCAAKCFYEYGVSIKFIHKGCAFTALEIFVDATSEAMKYILIPIRAKGRLLAEGHDEKGFFAKIINGRDEETLPLTDESAKYWKERIESLGEEAIILDVVT